MANRPSHDRAARVRKKVKKKRGRRHRPHQPRSTTPSSPYRSPGQRLGVGDLGRAGFKGSRNRRRSPPKLRRAGGRAAQECGVKNLRGAIKGPGPDENRRYAPLMHWVSRSAASRCDACSHNGCRPPKSGDIEEYAWPEILMPNAPVPPRGGEALPQGREMLHDKCAIERRSYAPDNTDRKRRPHVRFRQAAAGEAEAAPHIRAPRRQFRKPMQRPRAARRDGERLLQLLESRLDTVSYRMGFGASHLCTTTGGEKGKNRERKKNLGGFFPGKPRTPTVRRYSSAMPESEDARRHALCARPQ